MSSEPQPKRRGLPRPAWVLSTYFAEGYPYSIVNSLAEVFFKELGASLATIGLTSLLHLPYNLKFLWAPLVDRLGTRRAWLVGAELGMGALLLLLSLLPFDSGPGLPSGLGPADGVLQLAAGLFFAMAVLSATNDIAVDGHYMEALTEPEQARFVGYRAFAYKAASLLVRGPLLGVAGLLGFRFGWLLMALLLFGLAIVHLFFLPELPSASRADGELGSAALVPGTTELPQGPEPARSSLLAHYRAAARSFFQMPGALLALSFVVTFRVGESFLQKMKWPFLSDTLGVTLPEYALSNGTFGVVASFSATMLGGALIARYGLRRLLWPFLLAQNLFNLLYVGLAVASIPADLRFLLVTLVIFVEEFGAGLGTAVLMVYLMRLCHPEHKAAHFALLTALMSVGFTLAGGVSGLLAEQLGFATYFAFTFVATVPMMALAFVVPKVD